MGLYGPFSTPASTGGAGVSTSTITTPTKVTGKVLSVGVQYNDSPPATTDVTVRTQGTTPAPPSVTFLTLTNVTANGYFYPHAQGHDLAGALVAGVYEPVVIDDFVVLTIAQANDGDSITCWLLTE